MAYFNWRDNTIVDGLQFLIADSPHEGDLYGTLIYYPETARFGASFDDLDFAKNKGFGASPIEAVFDLVDYSGRYDCGFQAKHGIVTA